MAAVRGETGNLKAISPRRHGGTENANSFMLIQEELTAQIIGAAIEVHRELGPGLLESAYEECLCYELHLRRLNFQRQVDLPIGYKGLQLDCGYRLDIVVEDSVLVELKSIEQILPIHQAQLLTYLRLSAKKIGLLIDFNVPVLKNGIVRRVYKIALSVPPCLG
jgi:GxxExxY protein